MRSATTFFEPMEDRRMLAAATYASNALGQTDWALVVRYSEPKGVNIAAVGNNDVRVTGPARYNKLGTFQFYVQDVAGSNNSIRAVYKVPSECTAWDWSDSGAYTISTLA